MDIHTHSGRITALEAATTTTVEGQNDLLARVENCESAVAAQTERTRRAISDSGRVANQIKAIEEKV